MTVHPVKSILFVCTGNICRSPLAEGVFAHLATTHGRDDLRFDSAGLGDWHAGEPADARSIAAAARHGIDIGIQRCRVVTLADFERFDLILGMDRGHVKALSAMAGAAAGSVGLFLQHTLSADADVPDPYYGDQRDFERVYDMIRAAAERWFSTSALASSGQDPSIT